MKPKATLYIAISIIAAMLLGACSTAANAIADFDRSAAVEAPASPNMSFAGEMAPMDSMDESYGGGGVASAPQPADSKRLVIQNASLTIVVDQPEDSMQSITALAERFGGFVVDSYLYQRTLANGLQAPSASITIRVPAEHLTEALDLIEHDARSVDNRSLSGQDVTAEYTDLQSRLRNLQDAETMLRQIMQDATDTEDVLAAFNQLNYITEQIEVLKGQIKYYEESAAMSSISVELIASQAVQPITIGGWEPVGVAKDAVQALLSALQSIVNTLIWLVLYVLPILLVLGAPLYFLMRWLRQRRTAGRRKPAAKRKQR